MITWGEVRAGVGGAWRLARRDRGGLALFDASPHGFWASFFAAVLVAPGYLVLEALGGDFSQAALRPLLIDAIAYVIGWTLFPLAMAHLADGLDRGHAYIRYIVAYNWSAVVQMALFLPVALFGHAFPGPGTALGGMAVTVVLLAYQGYVAHVALDVGPGTAGGVVLFDMLLGAMIQVVADRLLAA